MGFSLAIAGLKGAEFLQRLLSSGYRPDNIYSYKQSDDASFSFEKIAGLGKHYNLEIVESRRLQVSDNQRLFFVGWQFMHHGETKNLVVFHDSLLPKHRGFSPTVSALIAGDEEIGVTAFRPIDHVDAGPIYKQSSFRLGKEMQLSDVLTKQASLMAEIAIDIIEADNAGAPLETHTQEEENATYSLWRDDFDYTLDFSKPADYLVRFINAVGHPYAGARTICGDRSINVLSAAVGTDVTFVERHIGKVWSLTPLGPQIVCGSGMLILTKMQTSDGKQFELKTLRTRFR